MPNKPINAERFKNFVAVYARHLLAAIMRYPDDYGLSPTDTAQTFYERTLANMRAALERGSYNHDGRAFRATCRELGIKHTRTAIEGYIRE